MTTTLHVPIAFLALCALAPQDSSRPDAAPKDRTTVAARRGTLRATLERDGRLVPADATRVTLDLEAWSGELELQEFVAHGSPVNAGDVLARFSASKLEEQLKQSELELAHAEQRARIAQDEERLADENDKAGLARQEKDVEWARRRLKGYLEKEREFEREGDRLQRQSGRHGLEDQQDELAQLEKMYKEDELVDATEEIVLKRSRRRLATSQAYTTLSERQSEYRFEVDLAIKQEGLELDVAQKVAALERQQRATQLKLAGRALTQERSRFDLERQRAGVDKLRRDRDRLTLRAPHAGILLHGEAEAAPARSAWRKGTKMPAGGVVFSVARPDKLEIAFEVPESHVFRARPGKAVETSLVALPELKLVGSLRVEPMPDAREGSLNLYRAEVAVAESDARLRPGLGCKARVVLDEARDAVLIPKEAVIGKGDDVRVMVAATAGGPFVERKVTLGADDGKDVVVKTGLEPGELVAVERAAEKKGQP